MTAFVPERGTIARTAHQSRFCSERHGRGLQARGDRARGVDEGRRDVVVEHDVVARGDDAEQAPAQHLDRRGLLAALAADEHGLAAQDRLAEHLEPLRAQRGAGLDDVGDDVGDPEGDRGLDGAVEPHDLRRDAVVGEVLLDQALVARRDAVAADVGEGARGAGAGGIPEGRRAEAQAQDLDRGGAGVEEQVAAGHAAVDGAGADVDGDVTGTEVEQLDAVVGVGDDELLGVATGAVARLAEHGGRGLGQRALVGDGDAQHGRGLSGAGSGDERDGGRPGRASEVPVDVVGRDVGRRA